MRVRASARGSNPSSVRRSGSVSETPSIHSIVITSRVVRIQSTAGARTSGSFEEFSANSDAAAASTIAFTTELVVKPLDTVLATKAADYAHKHGLAMADSIIYATAMDTGADLLTCDQHFAELPRVVYFAKAPR